MRLRHFILTAAVLLTGCGLTEPENTLTISGIVVAAADGGGLTAGAPIDDADVVLRYVSPLSLSAVIRDQVVTGADGAYRVATRPPSGQDEPECSTLTLAVTRGGFESRSIRMSTVPECDGAGVIDALTIELTPNP